MTSRKLSTTYHQKMAGRSVWTTSPTGYNSSRRRGCSLRLWGSTKSKVCHTLIAAQRPLSQTGLCERAGVNSQSFRKHRDELQAFDLLLETVAGWVVCLPYRDSEVEDNGLPYYAIVGDQTQSDSKAESGIREESIQGACMRHLLPSKTAVCSETQPTRSPNRSTVDSQKVTYRRSLRSDRRGVASSNPWSHCERAIHAASEPNGRPQTAPTANLQLRLQQSVDHRTKRV